MGSTFVASAGEFSNIVAETVGGEVQDALRDCFGEEAAAIERSELLWKYRNLGGDGHVSLEIRIKEQSVSRKQVDVVASAMGRYVYLRSNGFPRTRDTIRLALCIHDQACLLWVVVDWRKLLDPSDAAVLASRVRGMNIAVTVQSVWPEDGGAKSATSIRGAKK
jgi:hypothetical protein